MILNFSTADQQYSVSGRTGRQITWPCLIVCWEVITSLIHCPWGRQISKSIMLFARNCFCIDFCMSNSLNLLWVLSRNKKKEVNWSGHKGVSMSATLSPESSKLINSVENGAQQSLSIWVTVFSSELQLEWLNHFRGVKSEQRPGIGPLYCLLGF